MTRRIFALLICFALAPLTRAKAQALVFSTSTDLAASPVTVYEEELHRFDAAGRWPVMTRELLGILVGDSNGNALFDDQPIDVDAAHASGLPAPSEFYLSTTADFGMPDGSTVKDGDIFHFTGTSVAIDIAESFFETITGTSAIDVDAFATAQNGDIYFSFAEDEITTDAGLITQNGGPILDEQCVFRFVSGATSAMLHLTPATVVALFNHAFGTTATTVVDVDGIDFDPQNPGEMLLTSLSTAAAFRGKVVTSAGGGTPFVIGGVEVGPASLALPATTSLDALAIVTTSRTPVVRSTPEIVSAANPTFARVEASGFAAGAPVQFVVTDATLPVAAFTPYPLQPGYAASPLDHGNPLFVTSFSIAAWLVPADANGVATLSFGTAGLPVGINALIQTVDLASFTMSTPAAMAFTP